MPDGKQIRKNVPTFHEALQIKEELELEAKGHPVDFALRKTRLTQEQLAEAEHLIQVSRELSGRDQTDREACGVFGYPYFCLPRNLSSRNSLREGRF